VGIFAPSFTLWCYVDGELGVNFTPRGGVENWLLMSWLLTVFFVCFLGFSNAKSCNMPMYLISKSEEQRTLAVNAGEVGGEDELVPEAVHHLQKAEDKEVAEAIGLGAENNFKKPLLLFTYKHLILNCETVNLILH
jgi:hypothetical protein